MSSVNAVNWTGFLGTWARELSAKRERVRYLIRDEHKPTTGGYLETLLREALRELLPDMFAVSTGFVHWLTEGCSPQQDIIIWDRTKATALVEDGPFAIVPYHAARAIVEVKTRLRASEMRDALPVIHPWQDNYWGHTVHRPRVMKSSRERFVGGQLIRCIFAYEARCRSKTLFNQIENFYRTSHFEDGLHHDNVLDFVVVLDRILIEKAGMHSTNLVAYNKPGLPTFEHFVVSLTERLTWPHTASNWPRDAAPLRGEPCVGFQFIEGADKWGQSNIDRVHSASPWFMPQGFWYR